MDARSNGTSPAELVSEVGAVATGLGVLSVMLFPLALPALLVTLVLVLPLIVLAGPILAAWLLVRGVRRLLGRRRTASDEHRRPKAEPMLDRRPRYGVKRNVTTSPSRTS
jgi:hypothetical protein